MRLVALLLACLSLGWQARAAPPVPSAEAIDAVARAVLDAALPVPSPGTVEVTEAADERDLRRGFQADLEALPAWPGVAIVVESGTQRLEEVAKSLERPDLLTCEAAACRLAAPLLVAHGAGLVIDGLTVRLLQEAGGLVSAAGDLWISDAEILGWNEADDQPATTDPEGRRFRPWIAGLEANRTVVRRSRLAHLGYNSNSTQGLAFTNAERDPPAGLPAADIVENRIEDLWFGFFTWNAEGVNVLRNTVDRSHIYGLDPHDATRDMLIAENFIENTRDSHGIVMSREIYDTVVVDNRSIDNGGAGFFLEKNSWNVTFARNESFDNGTDGFVVYESRDVRIVDNHVAGNGRAGIRVRASAEIAIEDNIVHHNAGPGIFVYDWSHSSMPLDSEDALYKQPVSVKITGNRLNDNDSGDCSLQGDITILEPIGDDC